MPRAGRNRVLWTFAAGVILAAAALLALPWIASTRIVADRIAAELSALTGYGVSLGSAPSVEVWPSFKARLRDVTMTPPAERADAPRIVAAEVAGRLDAWAALRGAIRFQSVTVISPVVTLAHARDLAGMLDPLDNSRIGMTVAAARDAANAGGDGTAGPNGAVAVASSISIENGRIEIANRPDSAVTGVEATLAWPRISAPARLTLSGQWRGGPLKLAASIGDGLDFLTGASTPLEVAIETDLGALAFSGSANGATPLFADGDIRLSAPSLRRALALLDAPATSLAPDKPFLLDASLSSSAARSKLDDVRITLDGSRGVGAAELDFGQPEPVIAGTLAFETIDLTPFVPAAAARTLVAAGNMPAVQTGFSGPYVVDLRISAERALLGPVALARTAATLNVRPDLAAFDLSDATALGGALQAGFRSTPDGKAQISLQGVGLDAGLLADAFGAGEMKPSGKATINAMIEGPAGDWRELLERGDGSLSIRLSDGAINGFNHALFRERLRNGGFFGLAEASGAGLPVEDGELRAVLDAGLARVEKCTIGSAAASLSLTGIAPLPGKGLALSGVSIAFGDKAGEAIPFFVGGSWARPFFSSAPRPAQ